jgi:hypothetical protein
MSDEIYMYRDQVRELQSINQFVRRNTLLQVKSRLETLSKDRTDLNSPVDGITHAIEIVKAMLDE